MSPMRLKNWPLLSSLLFEKTDPLSLSFVVDICVHLYSIRTSFPSSIQHTLRRDNFLVRIFFLPKPKS